jgi:hypothetical protein
MKNEILVCEQEIPENKIKTLIQKIIIIGKKVICG